ncbi:MAG: gamma-glutamyltransferase family protein [Chloroflexi bacterium]|nr:gamma-glutamyltransferase family protein [Chloroflexota bacterium]MBI5828245.1 gamma-glutamyltransferase family protein [Chloroflexota bacterium]
MPPEPAFDSYRSPVLATRGMVASSQPLASQAGLSILMRGGNAADAAVATAAALNVTEPTSTGIGGDCFALFYDARAQTVSALNGSGRAPAALTIELIRRQGLANGDEIADPFHPHCVTVPGACAGWADLVERHGTMPFSIVLAPAIRLAEEGFPVAPLTSHFWERGAARQLAARGRELTLEGRGPAAGERFRNPGLARTFRAVAQGGKDAFYRGDIAAKIVATLEQYGGVMTPGDLAAHTSTWDAPISTVYRGLRVWECPPNGQGLTALIALNILEGFDLASLDPLGPERLHLIIEGLRAAFADARWHVADPAFNPAPLEGLLSKSYAAQRRALINRARATLDTRRGSPVAGSDTVYFCVVDGQGNACSFINSNYMGFGTGIVPPGTGFSLQNRGHNFSLDPAHPNALAPGKRPYHTIIPGMLTRDAGSIGQSPHHELIGPFGVMGGFMQPQGHAQVVVDLVDDGLDPQAALNRLRLCLEPGRPEGRVALEDGLSLDTASRLAAMGHDVFTLSGYERAAFGRGQIIRREPDGVLWGGSDPRADGCAVGF